MAFEMQQLLTSGRIQKCGFTPSYSTHQSSLVSDAEVMSPFSIVTQGISPNTSLFSVDSSDSSTQKVKHRRPRNRHFSRRRRSSKQKVPEDVNAFVDPLTLEAPASLSLNWLNLSFLDRTPGYADYFVNYWRHAVAAQQDLFMDHFTGVMAVNHEDLCPDSAVRSTQPTGQGNEASSRCIRYEDDLFAVSCLWDDDGQTHLDHWDEWRREDDEVHIPTGDQHDYGAVGQPLIYLYPRRNMGTNFEIVAPKPFRAWYEPRSWMVHPYVSPEPVTCTETGFLQVSVELELPVVVHDIPLYHLPDFHIDVIFGTRKTLQIERNASNSSATTAYDADAESTTDSEDMTKCTSLSQRSASPSSYLSAIAASFMPREMSPLPTGGYASPLCDNYPNHTSYKTGKATRLEKIYSREEKMFWFSHMSYDQKIAEIERSLRWMRAHSRRV